MRAIHPRDRRRSTRGSNRRRNAKRSGSILILVVALLVILALMGTAYLATARYDRVNAQQIGIPAVNPNIPFTPEKLLSLETAAEGAADNLITYDDYDRAFRFRPPQHAQANGNKLFTYDNWDFGEADAPYPAADNNMVNGPDLNAPDQREDAWIGSRIPEPSPTNAKIPVWATISGWVPPYFGGDANTNSSARIPSPIGAVAFQSPFFAGQPAEARYRTRQLMEPTYLTITYPPDWASPVTLAGRTRVFPAFYISPTNGGKKFYYLAADTDGDGIADAGLIPVPLNNTSFQGDTVVYPGAALPQDVTYWYAIRIVDNNSAINVNTARSRDRDVAVGASNTIFNTNLGFFRANIGLMELHTLYDPSLTNLVKNVELPKQDEYRTGSAGFVANAIEDNGTARNDFAFVSIGDAMENQLARRLSNPGYVGDGNRTRFRPFGSIDAGALAHRGGLVDADNDPADVERYLEFSLSVFAPNFAPNDRNRIYRYYGADRADAWYHQNFNFDKPSRDSYLNSLPQSPAYVSPSVPLRSMVTASNPVSSAVTPMHLPDVAASAGATNVNPELVMPNWDAANDTNNVPGGTGRIGKTDINTAPFGELWRAFWCVMAEESSSAIGWSVPPDGATRMFRTSLRDHQIGTWTAENQLLLRSALAAVNAMDLRDGDDEVTRRVVPIGGQSVAVYGTERQPYITEVYANNDDETNFEDGKNEGGYVAIELVNPYPDAINLQGWKLKVVTRSGVGVTIDDLYTFGNVSVPAATGSGRGTTNGYLVLDNLGNGNKDAKWRPKGTELASKGNIANLVYVPGLAKVLEPPTAGAPRGKELVLERPVRDGDTSNAPIYDYAPVDSYDFGVWTGSITNPDGTVDLRTWHYVRANDPGSGKQWHFVYPGQYETAVDGNTSGPRYIRTEVRRYTVPVNNQDPTLETMNWTASPGVKLLGADARASDTSTFPIQLNNTDWAGPNPIPPGGGATNRFPFGGFARNGDILRVPFLGAYRVGNPDADPNAAQIDAVELNAAPIDSFYAEAKNVAADGRTEIGPLCPRAANANYTGKYDKLPDLYDWASDLFDYIGVWSPKDDYLPNVAPYRDATGKVITTSGPTGRAPMPVSNTGGAANIGEDSVGIEGLVNINTVPWQVLAMLPLVMDGSGGVDANATVALAKAIVADRRQFGPFRSIFDLNRVRGFRFPGALATNADPGLAFGDTSPFNTTATDGVENDFEHKYLQLTRLSNLITTRSDSFTVYILVQAWQGAGTPTPVLLAERRSAFIVDRSSVNPTSGTLRRITVPAN